MMMMAIKIVVYLMTIFYVSTAFPTGESNKQHSEPLAHLGPNGLAEELSGYFEGDIVTSSEELDELLKSGFKTGLINAKYRWPNNTVPYDVKQSDFNSSQIEHIHKAVQKLEEVTCISFVKYNPDLHSNFIWVTGEQSGCHSMVGMRGGQQQLNLQPYDIEMGCFRMYTIVHEFIHALGFYHMQSATERDDYVEIVWKNIQPGSEHNFNKYDSNTISLYNVEYDYESVMHYSDTAFSINGEKTIVPISKLGDGVTIGQRSKLSEKDIKRINAMYC